MYDIVDVLKSKVKSMKCIFLGEKIVVRWEAHEGIIRKQGDMKIYINQNEGIFKRRQRPHRYWL